MKTTGKRKQEKEIPVRKAKGKENTAMKAKRKRCLES